MSYQWEWKPALEGGEWQPCPAEWCGGAILTIPNAHKSKEGSYHCVVRNNTGTNTSEPAKLSVGKNHNHISLLLCNKKKEPALHLHKVDSVKM